jgi:hypothetical protein
MVVPNLERDHKWVTYDEVDEMRVHFPNFPRAVFNYNETESWARVMGLGKEMISEESN